MRASRPLSALAILLLAACRDAPVVQPDPPAGEALHASNPPEPRPAGVERQRGGCATLIDAEDPDVLRVAKGIDGLVLYAEAQVGLVVVDVSDPDDPKVVATSPFTGAPIGVFQRDEAAVVVFAPWDRPAETVVRAIDLRRATAGRTLGEIVVPGGPRDAHRVGDSVIVTRDDPAGDDRRGRTLVTAFTLDASGLAKRDELKLSGRGALTGASPYGIAIAREATPDLGRDRTSVTWLGVDETVGTLRLNGTAVVAGVVPRWKRASDHVVNVTEDARVHLVACATAACPPGEAATYATLDFSEPDRPRTVAWSMLARAGDGVFHFDGERLIVGRPPADGTDGTELAFFHTEKQLEPAGAVRLRGTVGSIAIHGRDVLALGWTGSASAGKHAIVHLVDARRAPRLVGSVAFGGDWTWSPAYDDDRAISFDPASTLAALPMTTVRGQSGAISAVQVLSFGSIGPRNVLERQVEMVDRLLFVNGRLLAFSADGVTAVTYPGEHRIQRRWEDPRPIVR